MAAQFDLIIIGGGINGVSLARLAAFQGLKTALFEAGDLGQGASSSTSKLIHGGLRYLETFDFGLVRDAVRERTGLVSIAPHLVYKERFLFPRTRHGRHGRLAIKSGLTLYDFLAGKMSLETHHWVGPDRLREREPQFLPGERCGAYEYSDCVMDDSRLVIENAVDASRLGASIFTYHEFKGVEESAPGHGGLEPADKELEVTVLNRLTGKEIVFTCSRLGFALGPWTDQQVSREFPGSPPQLRLSQGTHLIVEQLPSRSCFILPVPDSGRYFFVVPWKKYHLIGTTETELGPIPPRPLAPFDQEIKELKSLTSLYFPGVDLKVICTFTGIRPLARARGGSTISVSREHEFHRLHPGVFSAVGGKYTTHRPFAEAYLSFILGKKPRNPKDQKLQKRLLPGGWSNDGERKSLEKDLARYAFAQGEAGGEWMTRYGARALELARFIHGNPGMEKRISRIHPLLAGEVHFAIREEFAKCPLDFLRRRTDLYFAPDAGLDALEAIQDIFTATVSGYAKLADGDTTESAMESADYLDYLRRNRHAAVA